ncbi:ATP-binding protein [Streptomyces wedmorensis]|uniref:ATP-binding protein n=1 Tax=Streptomyces wedmorensis TaxID=43759 RepID=UPI0037B147DD
MRISRDPGKATELIGRRQEREELALLLSAAGKGRGGALVLSGEAGIGKTALLDSVHTLSGVRVLRVAGVEFETDLAFSALHQLCAPVMNRLSKLPMPQRHALEAAFGLGTRNVPDRFLVGLAVLGLLSRAAAERPLVCVVDDAQWLDQASAQALSFAARRAQTEPVLFLFAVREISGCQDLAGLPGMAVGGLPDDEARALLAARVRAPLDSPVRDRIVVEARGNPLALLELPRTIDLAGGFALPEQNAPRMANSGTNGARGASGTDPTTASDKVVASFRARVTALPPDTRQLLLIAAAEPTGDPVVLWRAAHLLDIDAAAATPALDAELLSIGLWVRFRHPLVRSTVYGDASPAERRSVHRALADVMNEADEPDRRAWHRAQAAAGPDEEVARALERSADRAQSRGGAAAAAAFLEAATKLTPDAGHRAERALAAASAKRDVGASDAALELLAVADAQPLGDLARARAQTLRARIAFDRHRNDASVAELQRAAQSTAPLDTSAAREIILETLAAAVFVGRFAEGPRLREAAQAALAMPPAPSPARPLDLLLDGLATQVRDGFEAAAPLLRGVVDQYLRRPGDSAHSPGELWMACSAAMDLWDDMAWRMLADEQIRSSREAGALAALPMTLSYRALAHIHAGEFSDAAALVAESYAIAAEVGAPGLVYVDVSLAAWRGDETRTDELSSAAMSDAAERGEGRLATAVEYAQAVLCNGLGRYEAALTACRSVCELDEMGFHAWVPAEFVEAAVHCGRREEAERMLERLTERTRSSPTDWGVGMRLRSQAMLSHGAEADELFGEAVARLDRSEGRVHAARARLLHGEWLRREGRSREAQAQLRTAHETLRSFGAEAFAERAARELRATGEQPVRHPTASAAGLLTAQEVVIARLVATGATSREVGERMFLSPRTVEAHLRNVYRKLGIRSRKQLRDLPALGEPGVLPGPDTMSRL